MFFTKKSNEKSNEDLIKVAALLIHAAKIDENYSKQEEEIIKQTLIKIGAKKEKVEEIIKNGKNMLVIKPDECIDCGVCEPECPVDAIKADTEPGSEQWLEINKQYSEIWPNISEKKDPPSDHEKYKND